LAAFAFVQQAPFGFACKLELLNSNEDIAVNQMIDTDQTLSSSDIDFSTALEADLYIKTN